MPCAIFCYSHFPLILLFLDEKVGKKIKAVSPNLENLMPLRWSF